MCYHMLLQKSWRLLSKGSKSQPSVAVLNISQVPVKFELSGLIKIKLPRSWWPIKHTMWRWYPKVNMMRSNQRPCDPFLKSSPRERCKPALPSVDRLNLNHLVLFDLRFYAVRWPQKIFSYISETFLLLKQPGPFKLFQLAWVSDIARAISLYSWGYVRLLEYKACYLYLFNDYNAITPWVLYHHHHQSEPIVPNMASIMQQDIFVYHYHYHFAQFITYSPYGIPPSFH